MEGEAGCGRVRLCRAGQGRAGQGSAGQGRAVQGRGRGRGRGREGEGGERRVGGLSAVLIAVP